ncbi:MAG: DNA adenine methylase [Eubacteriales bacterium]|nr:DNA adenine methylase [Eubacteriales bacterium]
MYYSPLRYPGGKAKLAAFMSFMIEELGLVGGTYVEPFAGGAGIALELLEKNIVRKIVINDFDNGVYSFWHAVLNETERFVYDIENVPLTIDEWNKQRYVCKNHSCKCSYELGFATFYLNRTNYSGIIKGGVIGGKEQKGKWKMDARFKRARLSTRIKEIASRKQNIELYNEDIRDFLCTYIRSCDNRSLIYFDPPYFNKGKQLYLNFLTESDHKEIKNGIQKYASCDWIITYDDVPEITELYSTNAIMKYDLNYSARNSKSASEVIIFKREDMIPSREDLYNSGVNINLRDI